MLKNRIAILMLAMALVACAGGGSGGGSGGGGDGGGGTPPPTPPTQLSLLAGSSSDNVWSTGASDVAVDAAGNVYVADTANAVVRKVAASGEMTILAGAIGQLGSADGLAAEARFSALRGVAVDAAGNVYVADTDNRTIRKITPAGQVSTVAGLAGSIGSSDGDGAAARFNSPVSVAVDADGNVYVADAGNCTVRKIVGTLVTTLAGKAGLCGQADGIAANARFSGPVGLAAAANGDIYAADDSTVRKIVPSGAVTTVAGAAGLSGSADGPGAEARFELAVDVAIDKDGNILVSDSGFTDLSPAPFYGNFTIRKISPAGEVSTVAGTVGRWGDRDGLGTEASFSFQWGIALGPNGDLYVADGNPRIRRMAPNGMVTTFAGGTPERGGVDGTGEAARFSDPSGVATSSDGTVYVADGGALRKITAVGVVTTFAGQTGMFGHVDGLGAEARFTAAAGIALDAQGNAYVADDHACTLRKVDPTGLVATLAGQAGACVGDDGPGLAARFRYPAGAALDAAGNAYVADTANHTVRKISPSGAVSTLAGSAGNPGSADGQGADARFRSPFAVAVDAAGNVYVADTGNHVVRKIAPGGAVTTLAGQAGSSGKVEGSGAEARFDVPRGIAVGADGNLYVADMNNHAIRKVTPAGVVSTYAGQLGVRGIVTGALPGGLASPLAVAAYGQGLAITTPAAVLVVK